MVLPALGHRGGLALVALPCVIAFATCAPPPSDQPQGGSSDASRSHMVETQLRPRGITDDGVLRAMGRVPRDRFVPAELKSRAYDDSPLPIGEGQTISQPYIVAYMTQALDPQPRDKVLEIGTGSGYQAAVLAELVAEVYTIEIVPALADRARALLTDLGYKNVHARAGDGYAGWPEAAPFDKVIVTAAPPEVPQALVDQLAVGGVMVVPVGERDGVQTMTIIRKTAEGVTRRETIAVRFVPMIKR
jgi:protein-L-isoaspartate(D-aspartate) O-methyltransferase